MASNTRDFSHADTEAFFSRMRKKNGLFLSYYIQKEKGGLHMHTLKSENNPLFELYAETNKYMLPLFIIDEEKFKT